MILSHRHKFIFICSSKSGTTSMEQVLGPLQEGGAYDTAFVPKHIPPAILRGALPERVWNEYFKFVFVRNPWDWFVSQCFYNSVGISARRPVRRGIRSLTPRRSRTEAGARANDDKLRAADVDEVFRVLQRFKVLPGRTGLYQSSWAYDMDDRLIVDYIGRYETMREDFDDIMGRLGLDLSLPHLNRTDHRDYRSYYTDEARVRVGELWAVDVDNFGYEFEPASSGSREVRTVGGTGPA